MMKHIVQFRISKGVTQYVGEGLDVPIVTQGKTIDEVFKNLREAFELYLEGEDLSTLGLAEHPQVLVSVELETAYA